MLFTKTPTNRRFRDTTCHRYALYKLHCVPDLELRLRGFSSKLWAYIGCFRWVTRGTSISGIPISLDARLRILVMGRSKAVCF
jgi:hypothetical protein